MLYYTICIKMIIQNLKIDNILLMLKLVKNKYNIIIFNHKMTDISKCKCFIDEIINKTKDNVVLSNCRINNIDTIYTISDIHGDYDVLIDILKFYNVIDINENDIHNIDNITLKKSLNNIAIVQTGDILDQYRENGRYFCFNLNDILCLKLLIKLKKESMLLDNVHVILLYGNHDITNIFRCYGENHFIKNKQILDYMNESWLYSYGNKFDYLNLSEQEINIIKDRNDTINTYINDLYNLFLSGVIVNNIMFSHSFITKYNINTILLYTYRLYCYKNNIIFSKDSEVLNGLFLNVLNSYSIDLLYFINCMKKYMLHSIIYENNIETEIYNSLWSIKILFNERIYNNEKLQRIIKKYNNLDLMIDYEKDKISDEYILYIQQQKKVINDIINLFNINKIVLGHVSISSEPRHQILNINDNEYDIYYNDIHLSRAFIIKNPILFVSIKTIKKYLLVFTNKYLKTNNYKNSTYDYRYNIITL